LSGNGHGSTEVNQMNVSKKRIEQRAKCVTQVSALQSTLSVKIMPAHDHSLWIRTCHES